MTQKMNKFNSLKKTTKVDFATYLGVIVVFIITTILQNNGSLKRSAIGLLVPICCYMSMAVSLNLTVGILGELSLGHAGFMSVGAFSGIVVSQSLAGLIPNGPVRLALSMFIGALLAALVGLLIGTPVLRLQGDYLAIVTLAFGEIIKNARMKADITVEDLAAKVGVGERFIYRIENEGKKPSYDILYKLIRELSILPDQIFFPEKKIEDSEMESLVRMLYNCDERSMQIIKATVRAALDSQPKE